MKNKFSLNIRENLKTGLFVLVILGILLWIFNTFFAGVDAVFRGVLYFIPGLSSVASIKGTGIVLAFIALYFIGALLNIKMMRKILRNLVKRMPLGKFIVKTADVVAEMVSLPLVEVFYPSPEHRENALLRSVRWADEPMEDGTRRNFVECTLIMPTANNPTSGRIVRVEPHMIRNVLGNASGEYMGQVLTFTLSNPEWRRDRLFDPKEFLGRELIPDRIIDETKEIRLK